MNDSAPTGSAPADAGLDAEELAHLALKAMEDDRDEDAITLLKRAQVIAPGNGLLHYLLGALYSRLEMDARALAEMTRAVELSPELELPRFQLGLMHYLDGGLEAARAVWEPLAALPADHHLALFRSGLLGLMDGAVEQAARDLVRGLETNTDHPSLNLDIQQIIEWTDDVANEALRDQAAQAPD